MSGVNRCVCYNCSFKYILEEFNKGKTFNQIMEDTGAGSGCGFCIPYIKLSIAIGKDNHQVGDVQKNQEIIKKHEF